MSTMLIIYLLIIICLIIFYVLFKKSNYWKKRNVVQIGDLMVKFMFSNESLPETVKKIYDQYDEPHIGSTSGTIPVLILKNVEDIQAVLASDFQSFHSRGILVNSNDLLTDNLLFMENIQRWKILRQKLTPVFTSARLKNMFYVLERSARDFVNFFEDNPHLCQKPFNVLYTYTTASMGESVFGIDTQTKNTMDSPFLDVAWKALNPSTHLNTVLLIANIFPSLYKMLKLKMFGEHEDFFIGAVKSVLESRRHDSEKRHDFFGICLELQKHGVLQDLTTGYELDLTDELLAAQAFFFFIAGTDTTAIVMHYTLLELSNNPKILNRVHEEIDGILGGVEKLSNSDFEKLHYLEQVINESMRKYPPIGIMQRKCMRETVLPSGVAIEKDTVMMIPVYALHRDERYFPNPEIFDPERFSPENISKITKTYLPFGDGNRICIGYRFARLQMRVGLAWLLRRFTLLEQNCKPTFERSTFALRSPTARYELKPRDI